MFQSLAGRGSIWFQLTQLKMVVLFSCDQLVHITRSALMGVKITQGKCSACTNSLREELSPSPDETQPL